MLLSESRTCLAVGLFSGDSTVQDKANDIIDVRHSISALWFEVSSFFVSKAESSKTSVIEWGYDLATHSLKLSSPPQNVRSVGFFLVNVSISKIP